MNGLSVTEWWLRSVVFVLIAVWRVHQTARRPSLPSVLVTIAFLGIAANLIFEALAHDESQRADGRPYLAAAVQVLALLIAWCATCAYYAQADGTRLAWRITTIIIGLASLIAVGTVAAGFAIPAGTGLHNFDEQTPVSFEVARFYMIVLVFFPFALAAGGFLAGRVARRSRGPLRVAMAIASIAQWLLAANSPELILQLWFHYHGETLPGSDMPIWLVLYFGGALLWVLSFGAVAAAHRANQIAALRRAWRSGKALRHLLHDLETMSPPALTYPHTGRTPLLMRPHTALLRARVECRDRLVTVSPYIGAELPDDARQRPLEVAEAIAKLHQHNMIPRDLPRIKPVAILTTETSDRDLLAELADCYTRITHR